MVFLETVININYREITAKRVTPISFFMFNKFENYFTSFSNNIILVSNNIIDKKGLNWAFLVHVFAKIFI